MGEISCLHSTGVNNLPDSPVFEPEGSVSDQAPLILPGETGNPLIRFYKVHLSPSDGDRCPMYPSCSSYASQAVKKHGWFMGWIMTCDRLVRCGRDETRLAPRLRKNGRFYTVDPVEANDFWWCNP